MADAKIAAWFLPITPVTNGRFDVRFINLSRSLSRTILNALALPAAKVPPTRVARTSVASGIPCCAKIIAGIVEINKSSTTRNFIRAI